MKHIILTVALLLSSTFSVAAGPLTPTGKAENYVGLVLRSAHIGDASLNDNTPGLTFGRRYKMERPGLEGFIEGGVFYNSYDEVAPLLIGGYSTRLAPAPGGEFRLGGFVGLGYYKQLGQQLNDAYELPYFEGFIPIAGLTASYRTGPHEVRLTTVPAAGDVKAIFNLSYAYTF